MTRAAESQRDAEWGPWEGWNPSTLSAHEGDCCRTARLWFLAMNRSLWRGEGGPTWIANRYPWGPGRWPLHWCEAVSVKELCCGAQAALSIEAFRARGVRVLPVQLVQRQEGHHMAHWHERWSDGGGSPSWAQGAAGYHESCAVIDAHGRAEVWDPTVNSWLTPDHVQGVRSIAAIRIGGPLPSDEVVLWRGVPVRVGQWVTPPADP
ncbi:MAG: hypothetical protein KY464_16495, partial [Gemmatimonadetes bacterium]|nr:hypothetical protein [Gemmatimonadota bacterium]